MSSKYFKIFIIFIGIYLPITINAQFKFSGQEFPIKTKNVKGINVKYTQGIIVFTIKDKNKRQCN